MNHNLKVSHGQNQTLVPQKLEQQEETEACFLFFMRVALQTGLD